MSNLTEHDRGSGLEFAKQLAALAGAAPDLFAEKCVHQLVARFHRYYGYSPNLKKHYVIKFIAESGGTSSAGEIIEHFRWRKETVYQCLGDLEKDRKVEFYSEPSGPKKAGRRGRRVRLLAEFVPPKK
jgi:DNA-binding MarR family transcriptional regulator